MSFTEGDRVYFKGDPEKQVFEVNYVNLGGSVDLDTPSGEWDYVPTRLLEHAADPVRVGDIYRGNLSGDHYIILRVENGNTTAYDTGEKAEVPNLATAYQDAYFYTKVREGL